MPLFSLARNRHTPHHHHPARGVRACPGWAGGPVVKTTPCIPTRAADMDTTPLLSAATPTASSFSTPTPPSAAVAVAVRPRPPTRTHTPPRARPLPHPALRSTTISVRIATARVCRCRRRRASTWRGRTSPWSSRCRWNCASRAHAHGAPRRRLRRRHRLCVASPGWRPPAKRSPSWARRVRWGRARVPYTLARTERADLWWA